METKKDISYGVVPILEKHGSHFVFLIYQYGRNKDVYWTFPKGHGEYGETSEESATRELFEETGLTVATLNTKKTFSHQYTFIYEDTLIEKTVVYYVGFVSDERFTVQSKEVKEAGWFSVADALKKLTHESGRKILLEIKGFLQLS